MDFVLSKEHQMLRTLYRDFAEQQVKDLAHELTKKSASRMKR